MSWLHDRSLPNLKPMKLRSKRTTTGLLFGVIMLGVVISGAKVTALFFWIPALLSVDELLRLHRLRHFNAVTASILFSALLLYILVAGFQVFSFRVDLLWILLLLPWLTAVVSMTTEKEGHTTAFLASITALFILVAPFTLFLSFYTHSKALGLPNYLIPTAFWGIIWVNDMFAYFIGKRWGKRPLAPLISPRKTKEGTLGGILCSLLAGGIIHLLTPTTTLTFWLGFALLTAIGSIFGDLLESSMKRKLNVKDSGQLLPGHGGILDRFDSMFMATPLVFVYLILLS